MPHHLFRHHDDGFDGKSAITVVEQILEGGSQQIDHKYVVQTFLAKVVDIRDAGCD